MIMVFRVQRICIRWTVTSLYVGIGPTNLTRTVLSRSGAHPNQMKQVKMILKAQEVYFESNNSAVHRCEDIMTNGGLASNTGVQGTLLWVCHIGPCR